jgi:hypothetical protein
MARWQRLLILAHLILGATAARGQGLSLTAPGQSSGGRVLASFPLSTSGPLITEDANTVAHVYWNGTALVDTKGLNWVQVGTVPMVTDNPFTTTRYGAGPFSASNYYSLGTGTDVLDFAGDFTACIVFNAAPTGAQQILAINGSSASNSGWAILLTTAGLGQLTTYGAASTSTVSVTALAAAAGPNVVCAGRAGSDQSIKMNLGATDTDAGTKTVAPTSLAALIGVHPTAGIPLTGTIYEVYATSTPFTEATVTAIQQKVLGHYDGYSPLAVTRTTNATYAPRASDPSTLFTAAPGVARITDQGLLVEPSRTNYALQSNTMSTGTAATSPWLWNGGVGACGVTGTTVAGASVGGTWAELTSVCSTGNAYQSITSASSTTFVGSVWMAKASGSGHAGLLVGCGAGTPSVCTCVRSDEGTCTAAAFATNYCQAMVSDLGTTPVRLAAMTTCSGAITTPGFNVLPGNHGTATGTTRFSGAQLEVGTYPTSLIVTTTTATARNADQVSATVPAVPAKWCLAVTGYRPGDWVQGTTSTYAWSLGSGPVGTEPNIVSLGSRYFSVFDAAAGQKFIGPYTEPDGALSHRLISCGSSTGSMQLSIDGALSTTTAGAGTGILGTPSTTLYFGASGSTGLQAWGGYLKNLKICSAKNPKECR